MREALDGPLGFLVGYAIGFVIIRLATGRWW